MAEIRGVHLRDGTRYEVTGDDVDRVNRLVMRTWKEVAGETPRRDRSVTWTPARSEPGRGFRGAVQVQVR